MTTSTINHRSSVEGPFGSNSINDRIPTILFDGTADQLNDALGSAFLLKPKKKSVKVKKKSELKKKAVVLIPEPKPKIVSDSDKVKLKKKIKKKFNRNAEGATDGEVQRAAHLLRQVVTVDPGVQELYVNKLDTFTRELTNFIVTDIAPFDSALQVAFDDAGDMIEIMTGSQEATVTLTPRATAITQKLTELKIIDFMCTQLNLPADIRMTMIAEYVGAENAGKLQELSSLRQLYQQEKGKNLRLQQLVSRQNASERKEAKARNAVALSTKRRGLKHRPSLESGRRQRISGEWAEE